MKTILTYNPGNRLDTSLLGKSNLILNTPNTVMMDKLLEENRFSAIFLMDDGNTENVPDLLQKASERASCVTLFNPDAIGSTDFFSDEIKYSRLFNQPTVQKKISESYTESSISKYLSDIAPEFMKGETLDKFIAPALLLLLETKLSQTPGGLLFRAGTEGEKLYVSLAQFGTFPPPSDVLSNTINEISPCGGLNVLTGLCERIDCRISGTDFLEHVIIFNATKGWEGQPIVSLEAAGEDYVQVVKSLFTGTEEDKDAEELKIELAETKKQFSELDNKIKELEKQNIELLEKLKQREELILKLRSTH